MQLPTSRRSLLNYIGIFILLAGMGVGEFIYWRSLQGGSGSDDEYPLRSQHDSRAYQRDVQMYVGTFGLIMDQWSRAAAKLGRTQTPCNHDHRALNARGRRLFHGGLAHASRLKPAAS
jgi:hypothetical protein